MIIFGLIILVVLSFHGSNGKSLSPVKPEPKVIMIRNNGIDDDNEKVLRDLDVNGVKVRCFLTPAQYQQFWGNPLNCANCQNPTNPSPNPLVTPSPNPVVTQSPNTGDPNIIIIEDPNIYPVGTYPEGTAIDPNSVGGGVVYPTSDNLPGPVSVDFIGTRRQQTQQQQQAASKVHVIRLASTPNNRPPVVAPPPPVTAPPSRGNLTPEQISSIVSKYGNVNPAGTTGSNGGPKITVIRG